MNQELKQALFTQAYRGLKGQDFRISNTEEVLQEAEDGTPTITEDVCMYRSPDGLKCAAGHLIADEDYRPEFESKGAAHPPVYESIRRSFPELPEYRDEWSEADDPIPALEFLAGLQNCHDGALDERNMRERLHAFAREHNLTTPD